MYDFDWDAMHQIVEDADGQAYDRGPFNFDFDFVYELPVEEVKTKYPNGCVCKACGDTSPYAEPNMKDGTFKCWGCRNFG